MYTKTYLKAALHQLSLAKAESRNSGHKELSDNIAAAESILAALVKESYVANAVMGEVVLP